jgi:hypothetical protein
MPVPCLFPTKNHHLLSAAAHLEQLLGIKAGEVRADVLSDAVKQLLVIVAGPGGYEEEGDGWDA